MDLMLIDLLESSKANGLCPMGIQHIDVQTITDVNELSNVIFLKNDKLYSACFKPQTSQNLQSTSSGASIF